MCHPPFTPTDPTTWTHPTLLKRLKNGGTFSESFYRTFFAWTPSDLSEALRRAHAALATAGIDRAEPLEPIRVYKLTGKLTEGAEKRVRAERMLFALDGRGNEDGLFTLPWDREGGDEVVPAWFEEAMLLGGREGRGRREFRYPTIGQKFLQFAKERWRVEKKGKGEKEGHGDAEEDAEESPSFLAQDESQQASKSDDFQDSKRASPERKPSSSRQDDKDSRFDKHDFSPPTTSTPRPPLDEIYAHVGWLTASSGHLILEKGFRSLRTWFKSHSEWHYDPDSIRRSLRLAEKDGTDLSVFFFDCLDSDPWVARDEHAIAGAVERMYRRRGEVCFFVAREEGWVRGLGRGERMLWNQKEQFMQLGFTPADVPLQQYVATAASETGVPTRDGRYEVPGISVSLQKILGEQMMRQRVEYRPCEDPCGEDDDDDG